MLEANLRRVLSWKHGTDEVDGKELRTLSRAALLSYARYWLEAFRLPVTPDRAPGVRDALQGPNEATLFANLKAGRGVIIALPHMGNFDQAGAWVIARGAGKFTTVAERLRPESVYEQLPAVPGEPGLRGPPADRRRQPVRHAGPAAARRRPGLPGQRPRPDGERGRGRDVRARRRGSPRWPRSRCTPARR